MFCCLIGQNSELMDVVGGRELSDAESGGGWENYTARQLCRKISLVDT